MASPVGLQVSPGWDDRIQMIENEKDSCVMKTKQGDEQKTSLNLRRSSLPLSLSIAERGSCSAIRPSVAADTVLYIAAAAFSHCICKSLTFQMVLRSLPHCDEVEF
jgi:hypothetical protein